jgi:1,4-dihydroxy-2-naphthoate octaprenyltransferase
MSALQSYLLASRPRTWVASISPVLIGGSLAQELDPLIFALTLLFSLLIQIGTNFANDYFDFMKGADTLFRKGPKRATLEGLISPSSMLSASFLVFALALFIAIPLMMIAGLWSFFLAASCVLFGILYTGGPKPLGYLGCGEMLVFPFFGPVATCGTYFLQMKCVTLPVFLAGLAPGFLSCALLVANNLRDETTDRIAKKMTLIARFGKIFGKMEYIACIFLAVLVPFALVIFAKTPIRFFLPSLIFFPALGLIWRVLTFKEPEELIPVLKKSALLQILYTFIFCGVALL